MGILKRTIRGIRDSIPAGYVIGRVSTGDGPAQLIDLATLGRGITAAQGGAAASSGTTADFGLFFSGKPSGSQIVFEMVMSKAVKLPLHLTGSQALAATAPASTATFTLNKNGSSIGSISIATGTGIGTFTFAAAVTLAIGDKFQVVGPSSPDASMADIAISFAATFV